MKITREELPPRQAVLNIELEDEDLEGYLDRAYKRVVQRVAVPGFRPGKAPRRIVERILGREALVQETLEFLVPETMAKAVQEEASDAVADPEVEILGMEPVTIKATVPLAPAVEPGDYRALRIPQEPIVFDEEEVDKALEEFRTEAAPWEPVERPLAIGDMAVLDFTGIVDGEVVVDRTDSQYILADLPYPVEGFAQALVGAAKGETRAFELSFPEDYPEMEVAGQPCSFSVAVKEVKGQALPELDDEFAKGVGDGYATLDELRADVRSRLLARLERELERQHQDAVVEGVRSGATIDLPPILVEREIDHMIADLQEGVQGQLGRRVTLDEYVAAVQKTEEELRDELRPQAALRLERSFLLSRIADDHEISITDTDVDEEIERIAGESGEQGDQVRQALGTDENRDALGRSLRPRRTIELLTTIARGEAAAPTAETTSDAEAAPDTEESTDGGA